MIPIDFIVNPISGGTDKSPMVAAISKYLDIKHYTPTIRYTAAAGEAERMARESTAQWVVAVGGDGTVHEVARGLLGTGKVLGILPCGSGDGLALHLGISRQPRKAVETLNEACIVPIDAAQMNGQPFFCTAGMGLDAAVSMDFARSTHRGLSNYISLAWERWKGHPVENYSIQTDTESWSGQAVFLTVANANQWGNQARIAPWASLQDGRLDVVVVRPFHTVEIPDLATRLMTGRADTSRRVLHFSGSHIRLHRSLPGPIHFDGDPSQGGMDFDIRVLPGALQVLVPSNRLSKL